VSAQAHHVGLDPGFVDEHQTLGIEPLLQALPTLALARNVRAQLLRWQQAFLRNTNLGGIGLEWLETEPQ
jgi:hypothetical protein